MLRCISPEFCNASEKEVDPKHNDETDDKTPRTRRQHPSETLRSTNPSSTHERSNWVPRTPTPPREYDRQQRPGPFDPPGRSRRAPRNTTPQAAFIEVKDEEFSDDNDPTANSNTANWHNSGHVPSQNDQNASAEWEWLEPVWHDDHGWDDDDGWQASLAHSSSWGSTEGRYHEERQLLLQADQRRRRNATSGTTASSSRGNSNRATRGRYAWVQTGTHLM